MPNVIINKTMFSYDFKAPANPTQTIIFVHGAGGNKGHWSHQVNELGKKYMTIAVDLPGHGESTGKPCDNIRDYSNFIYDFVERVVGNTFTLAGHSMGGAIAMDFALIFPHLVKGLVLIGTGARLRVAPGILDTFAAGKHFYALTDFAYGPDASQELLDQAREEIANTEPVVYYNDFSACNKYDVIEQIKYIQQPALIMGATGDQLTPLKYSQFLEQNIENSTLSVIEDAGHMMMVEKPREVNYNIVQFLESI